MDKVEGKHGADSGWVRQYIIGLGVGGVSCVYGLIALWTRHTFLPGLKGGNATVSGAHGAGLAIAYTTGGLYLLCRFFLHRRFRSAALRAQLYLIENVLLLVLIASLGYVLWQVGTVG